MLNKCSHRTLAIRLSVLCEYCKFVWIHVGGYETAANILAVFKLPSYFANEHSFFYFRKFILQKSDRNLIHRKINDRVIKIPTFFKMCAAHMMYIQKGRLLIVRSELQLVLKKLPNLWIFLPAMILAFRFHYSILEGGFVSIR